jgi:hypothetical protein
MLAVMLFAQLGTKASFLLAHAVVLSTTVLGSHVMTVMMTIVMFHANAPLPLNLANDSALVEDFPSLPGDPGFFGVNNFLAPRTRGPEGEEEVPPIPFWSSLFPEVKVPVYAISS